MNSAGRDFAGEVRRHGFILRMVGKAIRHGDGEGGVIQAFNHVTIFEVVLTLTVYRQPPWRYVVYAVASHERIVVTFRDLVAECGHISERVSEEARADPA